MSVRNIIENSIKKDCIHVYTEPLTLMKIHNSDKSDALKLVKINIEGFTNSNILQIELEKIGKNELITNVLILDWINKRTDSILYVLHENIHKFIIIEVKTKKPSGCESQFKSMESLIVYLVKAISFDNKIDFNKVKIAKVLITSRISKVGVKNRSVIRYNYNINANEISYKKDDKEPLLIKTIFDCDFKSIF